MKHMTLLAMLLVGFSLTACNTTRGIGEDIEAVGEGIGNAAEEVEEEIEE